MGPLFGHDKLRIGESHFSYNKGYKLSKEADGMLVLYRTDTKKPVWAMPTRDSGAGNLSGAPTPGSTTTPS